MLIRSGFRWDYVNLHYNSPGTAILSVCSNFSLWNFYLVFVRVQLDLFTTLKAFGLLGAFLMFVGHRILSHLALMSAKLKSAWVKRQ